MEPIHAPFRDIWPDAELVNLLDDGLTLDRAKEDVLSEAMTERFVALCRYGHRVGADGLLATCSAFGPAIERAAATLPIPFLKPNEAMFQAAIAAGDRIGMIATFGPSLSTMEEEFADEARRAGSNAQLVSIVVPEAMSALRAGDVETHNRLVAERAPNFHGYDALMLAHFSTSRAAPLLRRVTDTPVLAAPEAAVRRMRNLLVGQAAAVG